MLRPPCPFRFARGAQAYFAFALKNVTAPATSLFGSCANPALSVSIAITPDHFAAIAELAMFDRIGAAPTSELIYFRMSMSPDVMKEENGQPLAFKTATTMQVARDALEGLKALIEQYANPAQPYYSKPRVEFIWSVSDYDRLARRAEWSADEGGEE